MCYAIRVCLWMYSIVPFLFYSVINAEGVMLMWKNRALLPPIDHLEYEITREARPLAKSRFPNFSTWGDALVWGGVGRGWEPTFSEAYF